MTIEKMDFIIDLIEVFEKLQFAEQNYIDHKNIDDLGWEYELWVKVKGQMTKKFTVRVYTIK